MKTFLPLAVSALLLSSSFAFAVPSDSALSSAPADQTAMQTSQTTHTELQDGTEVEIDPVGMVSVFQKDGVKSTPPDGPLTLKDGSTITVKDGKKV